MGFAGVGIGAAMVGLRPIIEFMTFNFSLVAIDQIVNNAAKIYQMSGRAVHGARSCSAARAGRRCRSASQHRQALESFYSHVPGLKVVMPSTPRDAKGLLKTAIRDDNPVVFIEGETLYNATGEVPDERRARSRSAWPTSSARAATCTLVAWSQMVPVCLERRRAARQAEGIECRGRRSAHAAAARRRHDRRTACRKTGRCVVVEVGWPMAGFGAEVAYRVQRGCLDYLDAPIERVTSDDVPMPYARNLEDEVMPQADDVTAAVKRVMYLE